MGKIVDFGTVSHFGVFIAIMHLIKATFTHVTAFHFGRFCTNVTYFRIILRSQSEKKNVKNDKRG
jgi:hypothetical protein